MASTTSIRFACYPRTEPPAPWVSSIVEVFRSHEQRIGTERLDKGLTSDQVLLALAPDLKGLGFNVETGKTSDLKIDRPVFFGENGVPTLRYQIDGYHPQWRCGIEIEAGRAWMGNAVYRDLLQAMVMVDVDWLCLAVSNAYKYNSSGRRTTSKDFQATRDVVEALYGHSRVRLPYRLLLIGY